MATPRLQQRFYPTLRIGLSAMVERGQRDVPLHCRQGDLDGACGAHCAAMALTLLGRIVNVSALSKRTKGVAARLWQAAQATYFDGTTASELAAMIESVDADLHIEHTTGTHRRCLEFVQQQFDAGRLVIFAWRSKSGKDHHWVLVVGMEGMQHGRVFTPQTFLMLDPGAPPPVLCGYNARLSFASSSKLYGARYLPFLDADGGTMPVTLTSAVAIGDTT